MLLGGLFVSIQDVLISDLTKRYPVHEIVFVRSLVNIWPLILLSFAFDQGKNMQITKFWQLFLRGGLLSLSYTAYYLALAGLDFAQATSLYFTAPLFITFLSWVTTRVPIGWRRLTGVIIGLVGVVFIVKPGVGDPLLPALMAVASAFFYALSALMTKLARPDQINDSAVGDLRDHEPDHRGAVLGNLRRGLGGRSRA